MPPGELNLDLYPGWGVSHPSWSELYALQVEWEEEVAALPHDWREEMEKM